MKYKSHTVVALEPADRVVLVELKRLLVIKFRNLGDVLLMTPVLSVLRRELRSDVKIDVLIYEDCKPILLENRDITNLYGVERGKSGLAAVGEDIKQWLQLRSCQYGLVINLTEGDRGALVSLFSGAKWRIGLEHNNSTNRWWKRRAYTHWYRTDLSKRHMVEQGLDALRRIGFQIDCYSEQLTLNVTVKEQRDLWDKLKKNGWKGGRYVVLHPTSRWLFKCITPEQVAIFIGLLLDRDLEVVLTSGHDDREKVMLDQIVSISSGSIINLGGKLSLRDLSAAIKGAELVVGADSVPIHMAAAHSIPSVVWFGPSNEKVWKPWLSKHKIISKGYSCRPCGFDGCGGGKRSECLTSIKDDVFMEALTIL